MYCIVLVAMAIGMSYNEHTLISDSSFQTFGMKTKDITPVNQQLRVDQDVSDREGDMT